MSNSNLFNKHGFLIRRRSVREIFDLTCLLLRTVGLRGIGYSLVLGIPVFLFNLLILPPGVTTFIFSSDSIMLLNSPLYLFFFTILTLLESDFVFSPMILFLGEWFFRPDEKISKRKIFRQWYQLLPQILFYLVFFRIIFFHIRQLVNILLLEKTPFRKNKWKVSTLQRSGLFHKASNGSSGDNLALSAFWGEVAFIFIMIPSGYFLLYFWLQLFFEGATIISVLMLGILFPLYCWSIAFFLSIYKFLTYLHLRIAQEGWDLEIAFKAELLRHREEIGALNPISQNDLYESFSLGNSPNSVSPDAVPADAVSADSSNSPSENSSPLSSADSISDSSFQHSPSDQSAPLGSDQESISDDSFSENPRDDKSKQMEPNGLSASISWQETQS